MWKGVRAAQISLALSVFVVDFIQATCSPYAGLAQDLEGKTDTTLRANRLIG